MTPRSCAPLVFWLVKPPPPEGDAWGREKVPERLGTALQGPLAPSTAPSSNRCPIQQAICPIPRALGRRGSRVPCYPHDPLQPCGHLTPSQEEGEACAIKLPCFASNFELFFLASPLVACPPSDVQRALFPEGPCRHGRHWCVLGPGTALCSHGLGKTTTARNASRLQSTWK